MTATLQSDDAKEFQVHGSLEFSRGKAVVLSESSSCQMFGLGMTSYLGDLLKTQEGG